MLQRCLLNVRPVLSSSFVPQEAIAWCSVGFQRWAFTRIPLTPLPLQTSSVPIWTCHGFFIRRVRAAVHHLGTVFPVIKLASLSEFVERISIVLISFALCCIHGHFLQQNIPSCFRPLILNHRSQTWAASTTYRAAVLHLWATRATGLHKSSTEDTRETLWYPWDAQLQCSFWPHGGGNASVSC